MATEEEAEELKTLEKSGDYDAYIQKINVLKERLSKEEREKADLWEVSSFDCC